MSPAREVHGAEHPGSSTWQSLQRGSTLETDFLNGEIVLLGRLHGIPTPVNADIQRRATVVFNGSRDRSKAALAEPRGRRRV